MHDHIHTDPDNYYDDNYSASSVVDDDDDDNNGRCCRLTQLRRRSEVVRGRTRACGLGGTLCCSSGGIVKIATRRRHGRWMMRRPARELEYISNDQEEEEGLWNVVFVLIRGKFEPIPAQFSRAWRDNTVHIHRVASFDGACVRLPGNS